MRAIKPRVEIIDYNNIYKTIEIAGRNCYKSEDKITQDSYKKFNRNLIKNGHNSVLEHGVVTVRITCDRGVSHQLVRHRLASYAQSSTRYCNYSKDKFGNEITVIDISSGFSYNLADDKDYKKYKIWTRAMEMAEHFYMQMLDAGATTDEARSILPNSVMTELVITANMREWINSIFRERLTDKAHPQAREVISMVKDKFVGLWNDLFFDGTEQKTDHVVADCYSEKRIYAKLC